jgi:hypothetical protein
MRKRLPRNEAATSEIIPGLAIRRTKLISNQLGLCVVYLFSCVPSEMKIIQISFDLQQVQLDVETVEDYRMQH